MKGISSLTQGIHGTARWLIRRLPIIAFEILCLGLLASVALAQQGVLTYHNDSARTGQNLTETALTPSNVNVNQFGKLFSHPVDGQMYAQPLYVPNVAIQGNGNHNVIFVATEVGSVYAFDANDNTGANANPLWQASLIDTAHGATSGETPFSTIGGCTDLQPNVGITSTPVIDRSTGTMYVEAKSKKADGTFVHRLHMLDITNGVEKSPGPVVITATVNATGDGSSGGQLTFDSLHQLNRPGLLLSNGTVYVGFASHCDSPPYHGWLFAYDAATFAQHGVFVSTPNGGDGGFWMSGAGLAADANGNIFGATGNGTFTQSNPLQVGDSILKFSFTNGTFSLTDYFTPFSQSSLNNLDNDLGSGGVLLLPDQPGSHPHVLVQAGKEGRIYLVDRDQMTTNNIHYCSSNCNSQDAEIVQESGPGQVGGMWSMPAYWNNNVYFWGSGDFLKSIPVSNGILDFTHITISADRYGFPGASPSISANGTSNAIVWSIDSSQYGSPGPGPGPAVLHAHDATNVANELWNSAQASNNRDSAGNAVKFAVPTIANGKVYISTSSEVDVYGLLLGTAPNFTLSASPTSLTMTQGGNGRSAISVTPQNGFSSSVSLSASGLPSGVTASFSPNPATTTSTLTLVASSAATTGTVTVTITGTSGTLRNTTTITLTVTPPLLPTVSSLTLNPTSVVGGAQSSTGTVTLSGPAPAGGAQVMLSNNNGAASVPSSVTVPAGATSATFPVNTSIVLFTAYADISASYNGTTQTASLTILL
jgi:hypothetical protein